MEKNNLTKFFLIITLSMSALCINAQSHVIAKYYNSAWHECSKDSAYFFTEITKADTLYKCRSYWMDSKKLNNISSYRDSNLIRIVGQQIRYYENGNAEDSTYYFNNGWVKESYHFFENGKLNYHAFYDKTDEIVKGENYDSTGIRIPGYFTFQKEAKYPDGMNGWIEYLSTHLKSEIPAKKKAPAGNYTVVVSFLVDKEGKVIEVEALNDPGYGSAEEAVRVIKNSPRWIPAIQNGKNVIYRQKQSITFQVSKN